MKEVRKGKGVSLEADDAIDVGLFSSGPATIKESIFAEFDYGGNAKPTPVWLVTYERDGETYEQPYSLGKGWKIAEDGLSLIPKAGQTGLARSCNAMKYLVASLVAAGMPKGTLASGDPSVLDGLEVVVSRVAQEKREGLDRRNDKPGKESTILVIEEIVSAPWDKGGSKKKAKPTDDDDEDEAPAKGKAKGNKSRDDDDEDDDDDEKPKGKSKSKAKDDDDEDEADDAGDDLDEEAIEAVIEAVDEGPLRLKGDELKDALLGVLKGNKQAKAIAARACDPDFLEKEKGWSFNGKTVTLD
jgi:hypothetical protein